MDDSTDQTLFELLNNSIKTGEFVTVVYHGGSQPGAVRQIRVITVSLTEAYAYDGTTQRDGTEKAKTFLLSKIEIPGKDTISARRYDPTAKPIVDSRTIKEFVEPKISQLQAMGWHVQFDENEISLHKYFKNGKFRKTPAIVFRFDEFIVDCVLDEEKWIEDDTHVWVDEERKSKRPYYVASPTYRSNFAKLSRAVEVFLAESDKHKPGASTTCGDKSA